jgi:hypothetical protein
MPSYTTPPVQQFNGIILSLLAVGGFVLLFTQPGLGAVALLLLGLFCYFLTKRENR